ncbi:ATP-binding protein [Streptomyces aidingensis]|uniref:Anti-sigma regulatory factor (Ser/Thr protein kinase) n=1 Tax=Streptomyces aidingensis TaxID=910347 RepID=A0A1I1Q150_9ACTN|nr:ATP-binding protein [Streptomyces aidingensis]SFD15864.1 Anti-sigma regulatory factor (Ser/Thr protein kinase) [Streptomyces aidingensis]
MLQPPPPLTVVPAVTEPWQYELLLPSDLRGPRVARSTVRAVLLHHGLEQLSYRAALLTTELVTNSVRYTEGPASVRVTWRSPELRVSVWDTSPDLPPGCGGPRPLPSADSETGRGLLLLDVYADRWGGCALGSTPWGSGGKTIWFELHAKEGEEGAEEDR